MKQILIAIFSLAMFTASAQFNPSKHTPVTKPIAVNGNKPADAKSMKYIDSTFSWRDYSSVAEAIAEIPASQRGGHPLVFVRTAGVTDVYWWKNGVADSDLVLLASNVTVDLSAYTTNTALNAAIATRQRKLSAGPRLAYDSTTGAIDVNTALMNEGAAALKKYLAYGDSMTQGTGTPTADFPGGTPYMYYLQMLTGWDFENYGIATQTTSQIKARFDADGAKHNYPHIFFVGTNDGLCDWVNIVAKQQTMVDSLKHPAFLIVVAPGFSDTLFFRGTQSYECQRLLDSALSARFPGKVIHLKEGLIAAGNPNSADSFFMNRGVWPRSLGVDIVHLNDNGERVLAQLIAAKIDTLSQKRVNEKVVSTAILQQLKTMFGQSALRSKYMIVNSASAEPAILPSDANQYMAQGLTVNGGGTFMYPGGNGGIYIRPGYFDQVGYSNMQIAGTNPAVWPISNPYGIRIRNDIRGVDVGDATAPVQWRIFGDHEVSGRGKFGNIYTPVLNFGTVHNLGEFYTIRSGLRADFSAGQRGIGLPSFTEQEMLAVNGGGPYSTGTPYLGELGYNSTRQRLAFGYNKNNPYTAWGIIPAMEDIPTDLPGAGLERVPGPNNTFTWNNTLLPASLKLSGSPFVNDPSDAANASPALAFDGNPDTYTATWFYDARTNAGIGLDLGTVKIVTRARLAPVDGQPLDGAVIQGSNTSSSSGWVTLDSIPAGLTTFNNVYHDISVHTTTGYRYYRVKTGNAAYNGALFLAEAEFYGYAAAPVPDVFATQPNNFTKPNRWSDTMYVYAPPKANLTDSALVRDSITGRLTMRKINAGSGGIGSESDPAWLAASSNVPRLNTANTYTQPQTFPSVRVTGAATGIPGKRYRLVVNNLGDLTAIEDSTVIDILFLGGNSISFLHSNGVRDTLNFAGGSNGGGSTAAGSNFLQNSPLGDSILYKINDSTYALKGITIASGYNLTATPSHTGNRLIWTVSYTGSASTGEDVIEMSASKTVTVAEGMVQNINFSGGTGQSLTLPLDGAFDGMVIYFSNGTANSVSLPNGAIRYSSVLTVGSLDANSEYKLMKKRGYAGNQWWYKKIK